MATITVSGASDDLIEIHGDIREEFIQQPPEPTGELLAFSDGTVLRINFDRTGTWRITLITRGTADLTIDQAPEGEDGTDTATLVGDITWVVQGIAYAKYKEY